MVISYGYPVLMKWLLFIKSHHWGTMRLIGGSTRERRAIYSFYCAVEEDMPTPQVISELVKVKHLWRKLPARRREKVKSGGGDGERVEDSPSWQKSAFAHVCVHLSVCGRALRLLDPDWELKLLVPLACRSLWWKGGRWTGRAAERRKRGESPSANHKHVWPTQLWTAVPRLGTWPPHKTHTQNTHAKHARISLKILHMQIEASTKTTT